MKNWIFLLVSIFFPALAFAQNDSLVIHFKNGNQATIALPDIQKITFDTITASVQTNNSTHLLEVSPSFPNPATAGVSIDFTIPESGSVGILVFDGKGNTIRRLAAPDCIAGRNRVIWDGLDQSGSKIPSGVYFYQVGFKNESQVRQMVIVK